MKTLVTGGAGFIGSATVHELHSRGMEYKIVDVAVSPDHDVRTFDFDALFSGGDFESVIHLAGILGTHELFDKVEEAIQINTIGTARLLKAISNADNPIKYVGISMMDVWDNVYQATKIAGERLAMAWHRHKGVSATIVRAFNGYGPYQKVHGVQKILPTFATKAWQNEPIPIWGDGSATTDLVHVDDIAKILVDATGLPGGEKIDAGTGVPITVLEVAEQICKYTESAGGIEFLPMRRGEHALDQPLVALGEGWDHLSEDSIPKFSWERVMDSVDWYREWRP